MDIAREHQHLLDELMKRTEPDYQQGSAMVMKTGLRVYGVRVPQLRALAREWHAAHTGDGKASSRRCHQLPKREPRHSCATRCTRGREQSAHRSQEWPRIRRVRGLSLCTMTSVVFDTITDFRL